MEVCPGYRYTIYVGEGCTNELPLVESTMGTIDACDAQVSFFGPSSCQLLEIKQSCGPGAFVCTYSAHVDAVRTVDSVDIRWATQPMQVGASLEALITFSVDLQTSLTLYLFAESVFAHMQPCGYMDYFDVSRGQYLEMVHIDGGEAFSTYTYRSSYNVSEFGGSYRLVLVKAREYSWQVSVVAQSPVLRVDGVVPPVVLRIDSYHRDRPLYGSWRSMVPSQENDYLAIYRVNAGGRS